MPARVEFRLGSIFDEPCDLLVIPSSAGGTVTPEVQQEIRQFGLPFPDVMKHGVSFITLVDSRWKAVAYAATVSGQASSSVIVEEIARELGVLAARQGYRMISAPLLGAGSGDLSPGVATGALSRGFMSTAPEGTVLVISIRDRDTLAALALMFPNAVGKHIRAAATSLEGWSAEAHASPARQDQPSASPAPSDPEAEKGRSWSIPPFIPKERSARKRKGVFISYSHADGEWLERLQKHLRPLQREGIDVWDDTRLKAGEQWREEIREALAATKVAILLISADFLASEFIVTNELPPLLKAAEEDGATILPVIISPCRFTREESLSRFQAVNDPARPLLNMGRGNREKVLDDVARAVEDALKR